MVTTLVQQHELPDSDPRGQGSPDPSRERLSSTPLQRKWAPFSDFLRLSGHLRRLAGAVHPPCTFHSDPFHINPQD